MEFGTRDCSCGMHSTDSCVMTTPQLIHHTWSGFPGQAWHSTDSPDSPLSWHGFLWFWLFLRLKTQLKGSHFDGHKDIAKNIRAQLHTIPTTSLPEVLPVMEGPPGKACRVTGGLLWRILGIITTQIQKFVFPAQGQILFGQASYLRDHTKISDDCYIPKGSLLMLQPHYCLYLIIYLLLIEFYSCHNYLVTL
jgi:hypothetical protein